jgi:glycosidase
MPEGRAAGISWWKTAVFYQIYPRSFQDSDGDGVGDLDGIRARLGYLCDILGVDAVWLSPFYPSPMDDFGYDVADYCDVDPLFGDLDAFDRLLAEIHERGMRLIVDLVPNHTSDRHPWFRAARSSRNDPKREWYLWRDGRGAGRPPNNWPAVFGGPAWEWDESTGQWYLHSFLPSQPDLNWRNPEVREAMYDVMRFWLDRGVDGFRVDVAHYMVKDPELRDLPLRDDLGETGFKDLGEYDRYVHVHNKGHPDVHTVFREMRAVLDEYRPERFAVGEIHDFDVQSWASYYGRGDELHMPFDFSLIWAPWSAARFRELVDEVEAAIPEWGWPNHVLGNHDETRLATRFGPGAVRPSAVLLCTLRGTPTLYYGDELGLPEAVIEPDRQQDPWGRRVPGMGRDGCRTPMPWDGSVNAGFCPPNAEPWLPLGGADGELDVAAQLDDPASVLNLYRALLAYRKGSPGLLLGGYTPIDGVPEECFAYRRVHDGAPIVAVAVNFTAEAMAVAGLPAGSIVVSTGMDRLGETVAGSVRLGPHEAVVVEAE